MNDKTQRNTIGCGIDILMLFLPCVLCFRVRLFIVALWSSAGKGLTSWLSFVMSNCAFVTFPFGIQGQVCYLIVSIPDLCPLSFLLKYIIIPSHSITMVRNYYIHRSIHANGTQKQNCKT